MNKKKKELNRLGYDPKTGLFGVDPISDRQSRAELYAIQRKKKQDEETAWKKEIQREYQRGI